MSIFNYKDIYIENGLKVLEMNVLPQKYCNFDCIFCPIGRSPEKIDEQKNFEKNNESIVELENILKNNDIDLVFINSKGEALINNKIIDIITLIKNNGIHVKLLSNGYILNTEPYKTIANSCDQVIGEIKVSSDEDFQKIQRPIKGYTLEQHVINMSEFQKQYKGLFILEITIINGYNNDNKSIEKTKNIIKKIEPDKIIITRINDEPFNKKLGLTDSEFEKISKEILSI